MFTGNTTGIKESFQGLTGKSRPGGRMRLAGVVLVSMAKNMKSRLSNHTTCASTFCASLHMRFFHRQPLVVIPPWSRSIARLAAFQPPKSSSAKMGSQSKKWAGFHTPFLGIRKDSWYWNLLDGVHCCSCKHSFTPAFRNGFWAVQFRSTKRCLLP